MLGSLHLERALSEGATEYEPGLLARAHRGILYVDEVNLLHDHLVDLLLDAAAMGRSTVERDGVSVEHAARFVLVGTMNPEEGELRPQLLDRFGLTVEVAAPRDPALRVEVVRRRMAYDTDPDAFAAAYAEPEKRAHRPDPRRPAAGRRSRADRRGAAQDRRGVRRLRGRRHARRHRHRPRRRWPTPPGTTATGSTRADIRAAARLALPHRRRRNPFDAPGLDEDLLDQILGDDEPEPEPPTRRSRRATSRTATDRTTVTRARRRTPEPNRTRDDRLAGRAGQQTGRPDERLARRPIRMTHRTAGADSQTTTVGAARSLPDEAVHRPGHRQRVPPGKRSRAITEWGRRVGAHRPLDGDRRRST